MANNVQLKLIVRKRLKTIHILMDANDWEMVAYLLGYTLECALKATICTTLRLVIYPEDGTNDIRGIFLTHNFDRLLVLSGMENVFSDRGPSKAWHHWSQFVTDYHGEWTRMRYESSSWDEERVRTLYTHLTDADHGILTEIRKRW